MSILASFFLFAGPSFTKLYNCKCRGVSKRKLAVGEVGLLVMVKEKRDQMEGKERLNEVAQFGVMK